MDPKQALVNILLSVQQIGQACTIGTIMEELATMADNVQGLTEWFNAGGFKPDLYITIEVDDLDIPLEPYVPTSEDLY
jgi:hypothetical protein